MYRPDPRLLHFVQNQDLAAIISAAPPFQSDVHKRLSGILLSGGPLHIDSRGIKTF